MSRARIGACAFAVALVVAACGGDDDASDVTVPPESTTSESPTTEATTTTTEDPTAAVEQAFHDQWDAFVEILEDPDPANPLIDKYFTGAARDAIIDTVSSDIQKGYITRRPDDPANFEPSVESIELVDDATAVVTECTIDGLVILDRESGAVVNDNVVTARLKNTFILDDGQWKLENNEPIDQQEGAQECA